MIRFPGVYAPQSRTRLISDAALAEHMDASSQVLDPRSGRGAVNACAAGPGTESVFAADISRRAAVCPWLSGQFHGARIRVSCGGGLLPLLRGRRYDLVIATPPNVPSLCNRKPRIGPAHSWDGTAQLSRRTYLESMRVIEPGQDIKEIVVIRARV